jgi:hypothetical protein
MAQQRKEPPPGYEHSSIPGFYKKKPDPPTPSQSFYPYLPSAISNALDVPMARGIPKMPEPKHKRSK